MIIPIISATLKSFLRSRRTLTILFILPVILIVFIFLSFNPLGLREVPAGITINSGMTTQDAQELFSWLDLRNYDSVDHCLDDIERGAVYACMNVYGADQITFELFFDNTREPVIWEIVTRVEQTLRTIERTRTSEAADSLIGSLSSVEQYLDSIVDASNEQRNQVLSYEQEVLLLRGELVESRVGFSRMITDMDRDVTEARSDVRSMRSEHDQTVREMHESLDEVESQVSLVEQSTNVSLYPVRSRLFEARSDLNDYDARMRSRIDTLSYRIDQYASRSLEANAMVGQMIENEERIGSFAYELSSMSSGFDSMSSSARDVSGSLEPIISAGSVSLVDTVNLVNIPSYVPQIEYLPDVEDFDGLSVLTLQVLFPSLLMLVVLFFGVLLSTFMMITHISTPAHIRIRLIEGSWHKDFFALVVATVLVSSLMIAVVLALGVYLFHIPPDRLFAYSGILFLILVVLSLTGIFVVHLVWSESMSVIVAMFALVAMLFSSGFILPVERMSPWAASLSEVNPISIGLSAFDRIVFYGGSAPSSDWLTLVVWILVLVFSTLAIRLAREL